MADIPIGVQDFKKVRDRDLYYVDKTRLIDFILGRAGTEAFLFTRPRRFGKSLNLSMLDAYFNIRYRGNTWFDSLEISRLRPDDPEKNAYPVLYLDMKRTNADTLDIFTQKLRVIVSELCKDHPELADSDLQDPDDINMFRELKSQSSNDGVLQESLAVLSRMLRLEHGRDVIILIDEYDGPLNDAYGSESQHEILRFMRNLVSSALKGNENLRFGVVTGVMQIAKESIFSGLNNLKVNNILSVDADEMFGFTPSEVERMCSNLGHGEKFAEVRDWYDGYRFGNADIYNPWSVLMYMDSGFVPRPYWAGTSGNTIIDDLLSIPDSDTFDNLMELGSGRGVNVTMSPTVTYADISDRFEGIYTVMAHSGYLRASPADDGWSLSIPNREMYGVFASTIIGKLRISGMDARVRRFSRALLSDDVGQLEATLGDLLMSAVSSRVLNDEHSYQAFVLGIMMNLLGQYEITGDSESGKGYHDIRMRRIRGSGPNVVIELKRVVDGKDDPESLAKDAISQIHDRRYYHGMSGNTILYGMAFDGKVPTIVSETITL